LEQALCDLCTVQDHADWIADLYPEAHQFWYEDFCDRGEEAYQELLEYLGAPLHPLRIGTYKLGLPLSETVSRYDDFAARFGKTIYREMLDGTPREDCRQQAKAVVVSGVSDGCGANVFGETLYRVPFEWMARQTRWNAMAFGYAYAGYDLGGWACGYPYTVEDQAFVQRGCYDLWPEMAEHGWHSMGQHKPGMLVHALRRFRAPVLYLDADAILCQPVDELLVGNWDIVATLRREDKINPNMGWLNNGVILFRQSARTERFMAEWLRRTALGGNDQYVFNELLGTTEHKKPRLGARSGFADVRAYLVDGDLYNHYYFNQDGATVETPPPASILHFKGNLRDHYLPLRPRLWAAL
jgi:hypothetical protein